MWQGNERKMYSHSSTDKWRYFVFYIRLHICGMFVSMEILVFGKLLITLVMFMLIQAFLSMSPQTALMVALSNIDNTCVFISKHRNRFVTRSSHLYTT